MYYNNHSHCMLCNHIILLIWWRTKDLEVEVSNICYINNVMKTTMDVIDVWIWLNRTNYSDEHVIAQLLFFFYNCCWFGSFFQWYFLTIFHDINQYNNSNKKNYNNLNLIFRGTIQLYMSTNFKWNNCTN